MARHGIRGTFFFTVGPDNMGRHLWRMARPAFAWKMLRTRAASTYGWDIILRGTLWPGPLIGAGLRDVIRAAADAGHEVGIHAWDHHAWQKHVDDWSAEEVRGAIVRGLDALREIVGREVTCSAVPGWRCNDRVLLEKERLGFVYNSDCRGAGVFRPVVGGRELSQPQVPVTLPTWDEAVGRDGIDDSNYNEHILSLVRPAGLNVLTIHAEVEGCSRAGMFEDFVSRAKARGCSFCTLGEIVGASREIPLGRVEQRELDGREGLVACEARLVARGL